jgi:hypothetical protein
MTFRFILLSILISSNAFSQKVDLVDAEEGAYSSYNDFIQDRPSLSVDIVNQNLMKNHFGNIIILPGDQFSGVWGIVLKGNLFIRRTNKMKSSDFPGVIIPVTPVISVSRLDIAFVRLIKYGRICLNAENNMLKLPYIRIYTTGVSNLKRLIKDDKELTLSFKHEKDKEIAVYRYIDFYNEKHPIKIGITK